MDELTMDHKCQAFDFTHTHRKFRPDPQHTLLPLEQYLFRIPDAVFGDVPTNRYRQTVHLLLSQEWPALVMSFGALVRCVQPVRP